MHVAFWKKKNEDAACTPYSERRIMKTRHARHILKEEERRRGMYVTFWRKTSYLVWKGTGVINIWCYENDHKESALAVGQLTLEVNWLISGCSTKSGDSRLSHMKIYNSLLFCFNHFFRLKPKTDVQNFVLMKYWSSQTTFAVFIIAIWIFKLG